MSIEAQRGFIGAPFNHGDNVVFKRSHYKRWREPGKAVAFMKIVVCGKEADCMVFRKRIWCMMNLALKLENSTRGPATRGIFAAFSFLERKVWKMENFFSRYFFMFSKFSTQKNSDFLQNETFNWGGKGTFTKSYQLTRNLQWTCCV